MSRIAPARRVALALLGEVRRRDAHSRDLLRTSASLDGLSGRDRALATRLVLGVTGSVGMLDAVLSKNLSRGVRLEPRVRDALRLSAFELLFLGTPASVAASQGVELVRSVRPRAAGLANAVLRKVADKDVASRQAALARVRAAEADASELALASGYPAWLLERVTRERGRDVACDLALSALDPAPLYVACNEARHDADEAYGLLERAGLDPQPTQLPGSFVLRSPAGLSASGLVDSADVVVADLSAQRAVGLAAPSPGTRVLEVGQGRGTKTILLQGAALRSGGPLDVVGIDSEAFKTSVARRRMAQAAIADHVACVTLDARDLGSEDVPEAVRGQFDLVFVDAPCSGTGTLRRHPEIAWRLDPRDVASPEAALPALQLQILAAAASCVRAGGTLCYATCSVLEAENDRVVEAFLASGPGARFAWDADPMRTSPAPGAPDGHFCARLGCGG